MEQPTTTEPTTEPPDYMSKLRKETKAEVLRMQEEFDKLRRFERAINPAARRRTKRRKKAVAA